MSKLLSTLSCFVVTAFLSSLVFASSVSAQETWRPNPQLETAILEEDWATVASLLDGDAALPPPARVVKGHALLSLNKNNDSLCVFLSVSSAGDRQQWDAWSQQFVTEHPNQAIAYYFRGDAFARREQWAQAREAFDKALAIRPQHPLVLNARGVTYAATEQWNLAVDDFAAASEGKASFADAYASRGALYIQKRTGAQGALRWFNRALQIAPEFTLALNGRAAARFALRHWEEARKDFQTAQEQSACTRAIVEDNISRVVQYMNGLGEKPQLAALADSDAGTTLDRRYEALKSNPSQGNTNKFISDLRGQPMAVQEHYFNQVKDFARQNPQWGNTVNQRVEVAKNWNRPGGGGEFWSSLIPKNVDVRTPKGGGGIGGVGLQQNRLDVTRGNFDTATRMQNVVGPGLLGGGVSVNFAAAHFDEGEWPVITQYGLLYPVQSSAPSLDNEGVQQ
jgi:tetratricopeptide (TPR) repeat protein